MTPSNDKISSIQVGVFVFNSILGVGILTLPASLVKEAGTDAWILAIISGLSNIPFIYFICRVGERYGEQGFLQTLKDLFGKFLGTLLCIPVLLYFVFISGLEVRIFAETIKVFLLNNTPLEFIIIPLLTLSVFLARSGVEPTSRFFEAVTPIAIVILVVLIVIAIPNRKDITNIRPFLTTPVIKYITGLWTGIFSFVGFEIVMVLFPFIRKPKEVFKASVIPLFTIIVVYTVVVIECISKFGLKETKALIYPTMTLVKASEVPGAFIEGVEGLLLSIWVVFIFTTLASYIFGFSVIGGDLLKHRERKHVIALFLPIMYLVSLSGDNVAQLFEMVDWMVIYLGSYTAMILPAVMFIMMLIRRRKKADNRLEGGGKSEA